MGNGLNLYMCVYICKLNKDHKSNLNLKKKTHVNCLFELSASNKNMYLDLYQCTHKPLNEYNCVWGFAAIFTIPTGMLI